MVLRQNADHHAFHYRTNPVDSLVVIRKTGLNKLIIACYKMKSCAMEQTNDDIIDHNRNEA